MKVLIHTPAPLLHETVYIAGEIVRLVPSQQQAEIIGILGDNWVIDSQPPFILSKNFPPQAFRFFRFPSHLAATRQSSLHGFAHVTPAEAACQMHFEFAKQRVRFGRSSQLYQ